MKLVLSHMDALIVVDMQRDFMPGGVLPVPDGDKIVSRVNEYVELFSKIGLPIFFTRDWHPTDHMSFREYGGAWPAHCVQNTEGALFHPELYIPKDNKFVISKGTNRDFDAYSGFQGTVLDSLLRERGIKRIFVCGVATDYCVKNTVLGGINLGYQAFLLLDAVKGVDITKGDSERATMEMLTKGAVCLHIEDLGSS